MLSLTLSDLLFSQGFGTRRDCAGLIARGSVTVGGEIIRSQDAMVRGGDGLVFTVDGVAWPYHERALVMLHKPSGYECSRQPRHHPSVLMLLPEPLRRRGLQPVGRLDEDTTGLLLLTDDGPLIHRLTSPKRHVAKVYHARTKHALDEKQLAKLRDGVVLEDDPKPVRAAACEALALHELRLVLTEGRYHQVKRMIAAAGNRVEALHRSGFGALELPADLLPGQWRWLGAAERAAVSQPAAS